MSNRLNNRPTWRDYQARLKRRGGATGRLHQAVRGIVAAGLLAGVLWGVAGLLATDRKPGAVTAPRTEDASVRPPGDAIDKRQIRAWLSPETLLNLEEQSIDLQVGGERYRIDTTIDLSLQADLIEKLRRSKTTEHMGLVAIDPDTGKVLAMVGVNTDAPGSNPCVDSSFPAASVFKIVTAAAAIEACGFDPGTPLKYNGRKYTLYKSQLTGKVNRYTHTVSFRDSFAQSINPVFGKIGARYLGRAPLEKYAAAFGFNRDIDFEVALCPSALTVTDESYHLAEVASGFNRETTLSPLHGALIVSAVLNQGRLPEPSIIDHVVRADGRMMYESRPAVMAACVSSEASELLETLMAGTVHSGTCRKSFRGARKDRVLSRLELGGKTGSIDNRSHEKRIDWFVGFAREKKGDKKIAVAVVVAHRKYIGTRAAAFARYAFTDYFQDYFAATPERNPDS